MIYVKMHSDICLGKVDFLPPVGTKFHHNVHCVIGFRTLPFQVSGVRSARFILLGTYQICIGDMASSISTTRLRTNVSNLSSGLTIRLMTIDESIQKVNPFILTLNASSMVKAKFLDYTAPSNFACGIDPWSLLVFSLLGITWALAMMRLTRRTLRSSMNFA